MELRTKREVLIGLMIVIMSITIADWLWDFRGAYVVPWNLRQAWNGLIQGQMDWANTQEVLTTISSAFLHADMSHLLGNLLFFWIFGSVILQVVGWRWMLVVFVFSAVGGSLGHTWLNQNSEIPMLGASGAIMGFEGAYLGLVVQRARPNVHVWPMARPITAVELAAVGVMGIALDVMGVLSLSGSNIAYGAHIGGFLTGMMLSFVPRS